ncbi:MULTISPECIES: hypothetical protein [unclassified Streptomyces]|uniref:hypothetical protein n=1 Tax=unclassified Streptomyces TaxID=2593676 RepID=UPI0035D83CA6
MRAARPVTGIAASAVTIATLGLFSAGPSAYAADTGTLRIGSAGAPRANSDQEGHGRDGDGANNSSGSGFNSPFGLNVPSLLDSAGGLNAFSGLRTPSREGSNERGSGDRNQSEDGGSGRHDSSSGRNNSSSGHDSSSGRNDSSSGRDNSGRDNSGRDNTGRDSAGRDSSGRDNSSGQGSSVPNAPSGRVRTGVGGSVRPDTSQITAGAGVLAATVVGGAWLLRRRASGTQEVG